MSQKSGPSVPKNVLFINTRIALIMSSSSFSRIEKGEKQGSPASGTKKFHVQESDIVSTTAHIDQYSSSSMPAS